MTTNDDDDEVNDAPDGGEEWSDEALWIRANQRSPGELARLIAKGLGKAALPKRADIEVLRFASGWSCIRLNRPMNGASITPFVSVEGAYLLCIRHPQRQWRLSESSPTRLIGELPTGALAHPDPVVQETVTKQLSEFVGQRLNKPEDYVEWMERWGEAAEQSDHLTIVFDGAVLDEPRPASEFGFFSDWGTLRKDARHRRTHAALGLICVVGAAFGFPTYVYFHTFRPPAENLGTTLVIVGLLAFWGFLESLVTWEFPGRPVRWLLRLLAFQAANVVAIGVGALAAAATR